jgi:hypothetical protein
MPDVTVPPADPAHGDLGADTAAFACPRCGRDAVERFWGPCATCRSELGADVHGEAHEVEATRFEPAAHVVPNHVATKD